MPGCMRAYFVWCDSGMFYAAWQAVRLVGGGRPCAAAYAARQRCAFLAQPGWKRRVCAAGQGGISRQAVCGHPSSRRGDCQVLTLNFLSSCVHLLARTALREQSICTPVKPGCGPWRSFIKAVLLCARDQRSPPF